MKNISQALQEHISSGVTTLAHIWRIERADGVVMGFTDHDLDLVVDNIHYRASSGFSASAIEDQLGLAVSNLDVTGALSHDSITIDDIMAGRYGTLLTSTCYVKMTMNAIIISSF